MTIASLAPTRQLDSVPSAVNRSRFHLAARISLLGATVFAGVLSASAQFTLPGGVRIQVPKSVPNPRVPPARGGTTRESPDQVCPNLVSWVKPLFDEYPQQNLMQVELGRLAVMEIPLFADRNFIPYFHKSYTAMTPQELDAIFRQQFIVCDQSSYRTQLPGVEYAFQSRSLSSPLNYTRLPASLTALGQARDNIARQVQALDALPDSGQSYDSLPAAKQAVAQSLPLVWPSERKAFGDAFARTQARLASPALTNKVEALVAAAPSIDAVRALHDAPNRYKDLFNQVPADEAQRLRARMDARSAQIGPALVAEQRKTVLSFTGTRDGLKRGAAWLEQFSAVDVRELNLPGASELAADYERTREKQLAAHEPELRRSLEAARSEDALQPLLDEAYPLASDRSTPEYARMQQAVAGRAAVFEKRQAAEDAARQRAEEAREARLPAAAPARRSPGDRAAASAAGEPAPHAGFTAHGLNSEAAFNAVYRGDFDKVDFGRDDAKFGSMAGGYMDSFWDQCSRFLTSDRVDITTRECTGGEYQMVNARTNMPVGPVQCRGWSDVPTGKFADRQLYNAVKDTEGQQEKSMLSSMFKNVGNAKDLGDMFSGSINMAAALVGISKDAGSLIRQNGCTSPELKHFQSNLLLFALGKQGVRPDGSRVEYAATRGASPGQAFQDSNYARLLEDMVSAQAKSWALNQYVPGTVSNVTVDKRDVMGRPAEISGRYAYLRMGGSRQGGTVTLHFVEGLPECLYFSDLPSNCNTPNRKLIAAYGNGSYR